MINFGHPSREEAGSPRASGIALRGVTKEYPGGVTAVRDVDLDVEPGEFMVLVGPSGCGKSSIMRMVCGLEAVTSGSIWIGGRDVTKLAPRKRDVALVFQSYALYPHMTARQNIGYGLRVRRVRKAEINRRVDEVARMLGIEELLERHPAQLSGGERQRVAMGRAIVREPKAFLLDEPLSNLDAKLRVVMRAELARLHERLGITTIFVTHDQIEAMTLGDRVAVIKSGEIQQVGPPERLYKAPENVFVAGFMGSPPMNLVHALVEGDRVRFGDYSCALDPRSRPSKDGPIILGIRPQDLEDAEYVAVRLPEIEVTPVGIEQLGSEVNVIFPVAARGVETGLRASHASAAQLGLAEGEVLFTARVNAQTEAGHGAPLTLALNPSKFYYFDPETEVSLRERILTVSAE